MIRVRYSPLMMRSNRTPFHKSKKIVAIAIGVLVGCLLALTYPFFPKLNPSRFIPFQLMFQTCEPSDQVDPLISEFQTLTTNNHELELQIKQLNKKIKLAEQAKDQAHTQAKLLGETHKAGTFGTVKGLRTNPTIAADKRVNPTLAKLLKKIAVEQELIVTLANANVKTTLEVWFTSINRVGISNYLVIALDDETALFCKSKNVPYYRKVDSNKGVDSIGKNGTNHSISGLKFRILREFLQLGYNILLSDVDIVYLQDPFDHLYRDSDVESMSDGHSNSTAYGFNDVFDEPAMGWARYAHTMRIWVYNSGFFYIRPTIPAIELLDRVAKRLETEEAWDQAVFNEELFYPSHPGYDGLYASRRTMDMYQFMNSKVLFKTVRKSTELIRKVKPVVVHVNYHVNKLERMKAVVEFYVNGKHDALNSFPDGSR